jgi:hypothetical protein
MCILIQELLIQTILIDFLSFVCRENPATDGNTFIFKKGLLLLLWKHSQTLELTISVSILKPFVRVD